MGLFSKIKNMFSKNNDTDLNEEIREAENAIEENEEEELETSEENINIDENVEQSSEEVDSEELVEQVEEEEVESKDEKETETENDSIEEEIIEDNENKSTEEEKESIEVNKESSVEKIDYSEEKQNLFAKKDKSTKKLSTEAVEKSKKSKKNKKIDKKEQEIQKEVEVYEKGLTKSREGFVSKLANLTTKYKKVNEDYFEELEEILIMADIGVSTVEDFLERLKERVKHESIENPEDLKEIIVDELFIIYVNNDVLVNKINYSEEKPTVILFVGVNGVGKTTTIGKIANKMKKEGKKVLLVGADTFRAGAVEQLKEWSERDKVDFYGKENSDPASVVFDGVTKAKEENYDIVLIDTAGRLQNKVNLMKELEKINKVITSIIPDAPHEVLLVIDATTGQNGVSQAISFKEITKVTGIVLTKLDGTAKGGIVLAIKEKVDIPVKYIGLGEREEDLQTFDIEKYIYGLFKDL